MTLSESTECSTDSLIREELEPQGGHFTGLGSTETQGRCSPGSTNLHHSCHTDKGTSTRSRGRWHIRHMTAGSQTFPSSFPCRVAPLFASFHLQGAPQDPIPQRVLLVWPLMGSLSPLYSAQSSPWWDHYRPVSHLILTACNGDEFKSLFPSGWVFQSEFNVQTLTMNVQKNL